MVDLKAAPTADTGAETAVSDSPDRLAEADCFIAVRRHRRRPNPALAADGLPVPTADALAVACMLSAPPPCWACSLPPCAEESKEIACFSAGGWTSSGGIFTSTKNAGHAAVSGACPTLGFTPQSLPDSESCAPARSALWSPQEWAWCTWRTPPRPAGGSLP